MNHKVYLSHLKSKKILKVYQHNHDETLLDFLKIQDFDSDESRLVIACKGMLYERSIFAGNKKFEAIIKTIPRCKSV